MSRIRFSRRPSSAPPREQRVRERRRPVASLEGSSKGALPAHFAHGERVVPSFLSRFAFHVSHLTPHVSLTLLLLCAGAFAQNTDDKQATFFMGRVRYSAN